MEDLGTGEVQGVSIVGGGCEFGRVGNETIGRKSRIHRMDFVNKMTALRFH